MLLGVDISTYREEQSIGARYYDGNTRIDPLDAFRKNGVGAVRIRLWNSPVSEKGEPYLAGNCDIDNFLYLASLAKEKGFSILLDFHYSDFWTDPSKQCPPKAWAGYGIDALADAVSDYTEKTLLRIRESGIELSYIQVGNEITNGILWPLGKLNRDDNGKCESYENLCRLLTAGCRACRNVFPNAGIILHLEKSNDIALYREFFTNMRRANVDYDMIGVSYYPYWHGTFDEFFANMTACKAFGKPITVMETGYGFTLEGYRKKSGESAKLVVDPSTAHSFYLPEKYPMTPEGQARFVRDFLSLASSHGLYGVFYWEPLWIPGDNICWASEAGQEYIGQFCKPTENEWANQCLFDYEGKKLPAFDEFRT